MAKIKEEDLRLNIIINGDGGKKKMLELKSSIDQTRVKMQELRNEQKRLVDTGKTSSQQYKANEQALKSMGTALTQDKAKLEEMQRKMKLSNMTLAELRKHLQLTKIALSHAVPGTDNWKNLQKEIQNTTQRLNELNAGTKGTSSSVGGKAGGIIAAIAAAGVALVKVAKPMIEKIAEFEQANVNLSTILGKNVNEMKALTDSAQSLGRTTEYTATQVTQLQTELAKLGFQEAQITAMQAPVLHFATAVGTDLASAASMAGATLRIFGLQSSDTEEALSAMAVSTNKSALSFSYLNESLSIVGPVANAFGFSLKDTLALLGSLANAGFDASSAATATRNILLNLADANGKLAKGMGKSVKTFPELIQAMRNLKDQGTDLNEALEMTDKRSVAAFSSFLDGADSAESLRASLEDVSGALEEISSERINTVEGSIKLMQSAWEGFVLAMSGSKGAIKNTIDWLTKLIERATKAFFPETETAGYSDEYYKTLSEVYKQEGEKALENTISVNDAALEAKINAAKDKLEKAATQLTKANGGIAGGGFAANPVYQQFKLEYDTLLRQLEGERKAAELIRSRVQADLKDAELAQLKAASDAEAAKVGESRRSGSGGAKSSSSSSKSVAWKPTDDESYNSAILQAKKNHLAGMYASEAAYQRDILQLEVNAISQRLSLGIESGNDRIALEDQMIDRLIAIKASEAKKTEASLINGIDVQYKAEQDAWQSNRYDVLNRQQQELNDFEGTEAQKVEIKRRHAKELAAIDTEYLKQLESMLRSTLSLEGQTGDGGTPLLSDADLTKLKKELNDVLQKLGIASQGGTQEGGTFSGTGNGSLFGVSQDQWNTLFDNLAQGKLSAESLGSAIQGIGSIAQEAFSLAGQYNDLLSAKEQQQVKKYEKDQKVQKEALRERLNSGLITQGQYQAAMDQMEEDADAYREEMALKQAQREKKLNIAQAIINTALGVTTTLAQWGIPWGIAPAAIMSALGAAQVAMIAATPVTSGYASGGVVREQDGKKFNARLSPDSRGFISQPTVLVGEEGGEYVIPASGLQNPTLAPFLNTIETARLNGTLKNLDFGAIYSTGRAAGGYAAQGTAVTNILQQDNSDILNALSVIAEKLDNPIPAQVNYLGRGGIKNAQDRYNRQRSKGSL